jgi:hypothetical protein
LPRGAGDHDENRGDRDKCGQGDEDFFHGGKGTSDRQENLPPRSKNAALAKLAWEKSINEARCQSVIRPLWPPSERSGASGDLRRLRGRALTRQSVKLIASRAVHCASITHEPRPKPPG